MSVIKYNNNNINDWNFGTSNVIKVYRNNAVCFYKVVGDAPSGQTPCFAVVDDISQYQSTEFVDVYDKATLKWYKRNNLNQYEEYGVYGDSTASTETYYDGKLAVVNGYEYEFSNGSWENVGVVSGGEKIFAINSATTSDYNGQELKTTFKIPKSDVDALGSFYIYIYAQEGGRLEIRISSYRYINSETETGTITNDGTYYYYSLPTTQSVTISKIRYSYAQTIHIIVDNTVLPIEYEEMTQPKFGEVFSTVEAMNKTQCPFVGQYGLVGNDTYKFTQEYTWDNVNATKLKAFYSDNMVYVFECDGNTILSSGDTKPSYLDYTHMTNVEIGDCVTSIGDSAFNGCSGLTSITIPSGVTSISDYAFQYCHGLTNITIPSNVTSIGTSAFLSCNSLSSVTISSGVTNMGRSVFATCTKLSSVTVEATTPPTIGDSCFFNTNECPIYVPCESVTSYKAATNWSTYASRIEGIGDCEPQYEELDYIERNASYSGYIPSLGVTLKSNTVFEIQFKPTSNGGGLILGESNSPSDNDDYRIFFYSTRMYYDYGSKRINKSMSLNTIYTFKVGNYYVRSGSTFSSNVMSSTTQSSSVATSHTRNIELFDGNSPDYALIYYLKVYEGNTLVKDFIPVRMNGIATLLDRLTNEPLVVNGTLKGSDDT